MRVLTVATYYLPYVSGLTVYAQRIAEGLVRRGHECRVVCACHVPTLPLSEERNGVKVRRAPARARLSRGFVAPQIFSLLQTEMDWADVAIVHGPFAEGPWFAWVARREKLPFVYVHHTDIVLPSGAGNRLVEWLTWRSMEKTAAGAAAVVGPSEDYARESRFLSKFRDKLFLVYPPVPMPRGGRGSRFLPCARGRKPVLGFAGRFVEEKRPDIALAAVGCLRAQGFEKIVLLVAGQSRVHYEDYYRKCLRLLKSVRDYVRFLGVIDDVDSLASFYSACDVFLLPSDRESFAMVQVEAMLCGTPVVASDIPGGRVPVLVTGMGELFEPGSPNDLAEKTKQVLQHRSVYVKPRDVIEKVFSYGRTLEAYEALLASVAG